MVLYGRRIQVNVAGLEITEPRINVSIERTPDETEDVGQVAIYNLSPSRERQIYERGGPIQIEAGYPSTVAQIFDGHVQRVRHPRENLARITRIWLGDAAREKAMLGGVSSRTYFGPVPVRQIATDLIADMGMEPGPLDAIPGETITNFVWFGPAAEGLSVLIRRFGLHWFDDDGVVRFRMNNTTQSDAPLIRINPNNGLIGSPLLTDEGAECTMFCQPQAKIGGRLVLQSESLSGVFNIVAVRHSLDNWDGAFTTWVDLREL